jgi:glyoxylase-like metal-dependent hydrolase (beta-lactamase superfamily II)
VDSASRVYGPLLDSLYGRLDPTPAERIHVLADGEEIRTGNEHVLTTVDSPGHAKHHLALHDSASGILFAGDAVGVRLPDAGVLRPATPPPDFDLDQAVNSLHRFAQRHPSGLALAHYGLLDDAEPVLVEAEQTLRAWAAVAEEAWKSGRDIASALAESFAGDYSTLDSAERSKLETLNGVHSNAAGFRRWLEKRSSEGAQEVNV